jgi:histidinol-phosphatase
VALALADQADAVTLDRFGAVDLRVDTKPDLTPVSDADHAVETGLRTTLARARPDDAVLGEEFGGSTTLTGRQWIIDPIDGTKNFVRGVPVWASLIALLDDGVPQVGVVSAPALHRRWWASAGAGAFVAVGDTAARRLSVSSVAQLNSASLSFSSLSGWNQLGLRDRFLDLTDEVWRVRAFDIAAEPEVSVWDLSPLDILVREAGGTFTSLDGSPGPYGGSAVATNALLHDQVLTRLAATEPNL